MSHLSETLAAYQARDPAARSKLEIFLLYPGVHATLYHQAAHFCYCHKMKFLARTISQWSRFWTGIEIHPGAKIGRRLVIDHGMGIVIGETAEVGDDCLIYHGVTLGGTGKDQGKRHPFKVGDNARIAANAVVLKEIPENATAVGVPARVVRIAGEKANFVGNVDQVNVTDPVQKELEAINARLTWLENYLDRTHQPEEKKDRKENQHEAV